MLRTLTAAIAIFVIGLAPAPAQQKDLGKGKQKRVPVTVAIAQCGDSFHAAIDRPGYFGRVLLKGGVEFYNVWIKTSPAQDPPVWFMFNLTNRLDEPIPGRMLVRFLRAGNQTSMAGLDDIPEVRAAGDALLAGARTLADKVCSREQIAKGERIIMSPPTDPRPEPLEGLMQRLYDVGTRAARPK
jgi:hypothetical protein